MYRFKNFSAFMLDRPEILIHNRNLDSKALNKLNITSEELKEAMKEHGVAHSTDVNLAMIELSYKKNILVTTMLDSFKKYFQSKTDLTDEQFHFLTAKLQFKKVEKGTFLLQQGNICHYSFFVSKGLLRSYTIDESGKEHIIQFAPENWIVSDRSSLYFNEPSELFIDAIEETEVVFIDKNFIDAAAEISASFRQQDNTALHNHIRQLQKRVNLLLGATAEQRYLDFITIYPSLTLRIPQWMIASYLGITPETLSRVRKELAKRNFKPY